MAKQKGTIEKVVQSAADAAEELGAAATSFKESWAHVKKAQKKAAPATKAATRAGKRAVQAGKKAVRKVTGKRSR